MRTGEQNLAAARDQNHHRRGDARVGDEPARGAFLRTLVRLRAGGRPAAAAVAVRRVPVDDLERARGECSYAVQRDIYGNPLAQLICPNQPDARGYLIGLFTDLVTNYDLDFVQTCLVPFASGRLRRSPAN